MRKIKLTALALVLAMGIGALSGCSDEAEPQLEYIDAGALANASLPQITAVNLENGDNPSAAGGSSNGEDPGNSSTDDPVSDSTSSAPTESKTAEIVIPNVSEYGTYIAEFGVFDPEKVKSVLLGDVDITPEIRSYEDDPDHPYPSYSWDTDGVSLDVNNNYPSLNLRKESTDLITMMFLPPDDRSNGWVDDYEHINDELDFCTRDQAIKNVKEMLTKMDITVSDSADVYTLCQSDLQKLVDEKIAAGNFFYPHSSIKDPDSKPLPSYTVDRSQEGYYIVFKQENSGVPVYNFHHHYKTFTDLTIFHPEITAVYSAGGLVLLDVNEYRGNITETGKVTQLISPESAVQSVTKKYTDMGASRVDFDKMELMYVLTPNTIDGKINILKAKLIPAWVCTVCYTQWTLDKEIRDYGYVTSKEVVLIDAQTGVEII